MNYRHVSVGLVILLPTMEKVYSCHRNEIPTSFRDGSRQFSHSVSLLLQRLPRGYLLLRHSVGLPLPTAPASQQSPMHWFSSFYEEGINTFRIITQAPSSHVITTHSASSKERLSGVLLSSTFC